MFGLYSLLIWYEVPGLLHRLHNFCKIANKIVHTQIFQLFFLFFFTAAPKSADNQPSYRP